MMRDLMCKAALALAIAAGTGAVAHASEDKIAFDKFAPLEVEADGAGFSWRVEVLRSGGSKVSVIRGKMRSQIYTSPGECYVAHQFDAPQHPRPHMVMQLVNCHEAGSRAYLVAFKVGKTVSVRRYVGPSSCVDFTECRVSGGARLHHF